MKEIFEEALRLIDKNEPFVIVTVVRTIGSTPQKAGAKLLIRKDGSTMGALGGGCIEGEVWSLSARILKERGSPLFRRYVLNEEFAARDGLVCGGTMDFFIDPILSPHHVKPFAEEIVQAYYGGSSVVLATVVNALDGKNNLGNKLIVKENGLMWGSFGDAVLEEEVRKVAQSVAASGGNQFFQAYDGTGIFVEGFGTAPLLVLMGGGHVNKAVSRIAATVGFRIYVIDDRPEFANQDRFPDAEGMVIDTYNDALEKVPVNTNTYIVVATRGHRYDDMALLAAIRTPARYVGLLGSKRKTLEIYKNILKENIPMERIREIHAPIGLHIGAITPEEIAVSIIAEIIMIQRGGNGTPMKMDKKYLDAIIAKSNISKIPTDLKF